MARRREDLQRQVRYSEGRRLLGVGGGGWPEIRFRNAWNSSVGVQGGTASLVTGSALCGGRRDTAMVEKDPLELI